MGNWIKKKSYGLETNAVELVRYSYTKMQEEDPAKFINFVLGGFTTQHLVEEADVIARDYEQGAKWVENDPHFDSLVEKHMETADDFPEHEPSSDYLYEGETDG